jgi:hypothetical protein
MPSCSILHSPLSILHSFGTWLTTIQTRPDLPDLADLPDLPPDLELEDADGFHAS